ncbi:hypothetical protein BH10CYA1_BH10CYA1_26380 [soil metagenome]
MLLHTLAGPAIIITALFSATVLLAGSTVTGTISDLRVTEDSEGSKSYVVKYDYGFNNHLYHASGSTSKSRYAELNTGDSVTAKVLPPLPNFGTQLLDGNAHCPSIWFMFGFGVAWTVLMLLPFHQVYIAPYRRTKVMTNGKVCLGKITDKSIGGEERNNYAISFQYEPSPGQYRTDRREVSQAHFYVAKTGETVSVLYDPEHLSHSLIYRYSDYELAQ